MVDKIDMALDDIIKMTRRPGGGAGRKFQGGARRGGGVDERNGRGRVRAGGAVNKPISNYTPWKHDTYNEGGGGGRKVNTASSLTTGPTRLLISNLDFDVSDSDIQEIFSEFGMLKNASVHYERSGRSLGTADVVFERWSDAVKAMKQYNGVPLDGRAMNIQLATSDINSFRTEERVGRPNKLNRINTFRGAMRGVSAGGGRVQGADGHGGRGGKKPTPTAEQLDAELDAQAHVKKVKGCTRSRK